MASNRGVAYMGPGKVEVQSIDYPELKTPDGTIGAWRSSTIRMQCWP